MYPGGMEPSRARSVKALKERDPEAPPGSEPPGVVGVAASHIHNMACSYPGVKV